MEPPASSGPQPKQPRGLLSPREKASLRGAVRAYVHTRAPGPLPAPGAALRLEEVGVARLQRRRLQVGGGGGWRLERDAPTAGTPRMCRGFLGTRDSLLRDPSCEAEGGGVPSGFGGGLAAWLGGSGFQETGLKQVLGFGVLGVPSRQAPRHTQPQDWAASWPWSSPPHQGFR